MGPLPSARVLAPTAGAIFILVLRVGPRDTSFVQIGSGGVNTPGGPAGDGRDGIIQVSGDPDPLGRDAFVGSGCSASSGHGAGMAGRFVGTGGLAGDRFVGVHTV